MKYVDGDTTRFIGKWRGEVTRRDDPLQQGRLKVKIPEVLGDLESNWALPCFVDPKSTRIPEIGAMVWVEFENGEVNRPVWVGCLPSAATGLKPASKLARGDDTDESVLMPRGTDTASLPSGRVIQDPPSAFNAAYGQNKVYESASGHRLEIDDTDGNERLMVYHKSGTVIEIVDDGSIRISAQNQSVLVEGDDIKHVHRKQVQSVDDSAEYEWRKDVQATVTGKTLITLKDTVQENYQGPVVISDYAGAKEERIGGEYNQEVRGGLSQKIVGPWQLVAASRQDIMIVERSQELIGNAGLASYGKEITVLLGNILLKALAGSVTLEGLIVQLGSKLAFEPVILGLAFSLLYNTHVHSDPASGVTGPPLAPMIPGIHTSRSVFAI